MKDSLRNKVVVITGASSGIGRSIALESAGRGATVILIARRKNQLDEIAAEAKELSGAEAYVFPTDMGKPEEIEQTFNAITKQVKHIDFLVNCAVLVNSKNLWTKKCKTLPICSKLMF